MADNTVLNSGSGGDSIRSIDRSGSGPKTQVVNVDIGASGAGNETILRKGQTTMAESVPVVLASNQSAVTIIAVQDSLVTGTITTATSTVTASATNRNLATVSIRGTYAGVTFVIEATDDGTNYYPLQAVNNSTGVAASTWTPGTNATASYDVAIGGFTGLRIRATAWTSGTANVGITMQALAHDPVVAALSQGIAAHATAVTGNPVLIGGSDGTNAYRLLTDTSGRPQINVAQINGVAPTMGNGASGTGVQRVTIASDSTGVLASVGSITTSVTPGTAAANLGKAEDAAHTSGDTGVFALAVRNDAAATAPTSTNADYSQISVDDRGRVWQALSSATVTTTVTRPADTTAYTADDCLSNSTTAPTAGGFTLTGMALQSGGGGMITDLLVVSSNNPTTKLQGELWIFDSAATAVNDNAAFTLSDADALKLVAIVPFTLNQYGDSSATGNSMAHIQGIDIGYNCVGAADLRFLIKVKNAYTPASGETITVRAKCIRY